MESGLRKTILLIGIVVLAVTLACGGGSDGGSSAGSAEQTSDNNQQGTGEGAGPVVVPSVFDFSLIANATTTSPLTISQADTSPERSVVIRNTSSETVTGTLTLIQEGTSSGLVTFNRNDVVNVTASNFWGESSRDLAIRVIVPIVFPEGMPAGSETTPSTGAYTVSYTTRTGGTDTITVTFGSPSESAGISVRMNEQDALVMGPASFEALLGSDADGWEQKAHLSYIVLKELAEAVALSAQTIRAAELNRDALESSLPAAGGIGSVVFAGDQFVPAGVVADAVTGSRTLIWTDVSADSLVDGGDSFQWRFENDWENRQGSVVNDLTNGVMDLAAFIMSTTERDGQTVLSSTGFQTTDGSRPAVLFENFGQTEVDEESQGVFTVNGDRVFVMDGGFDILFNG